MLAQLKKLTEKICLERPGTDLSFWRSAYLELKEGETDHLTACYARLIEVLLGLDTKPLVPCATLSGYPLLSDKAGPMCTTSQAEEIAHLWQWIGYLKSDQKLQVAGAKAAKLLEGLSKFPGLWQRESEPELALFAKKFPAFELELDQIPTLQDPELGLSVFEDHGLKIGLTAVGHESGFGSLIRDDVGILSFGPTLWPKTNYGLNLAPTDLNSLHEHRALPGYHAKLHGQITHYAAWSRMQYEGKHIWCELSVQANRDVHLALRFLDLKSQPISVLYAVKAEALKIGNQLELASGSLKQYKGEAKTVALEGKSSQMVIIPEKQGKMEVIPLAGDSRYWGANFLIIYPVEPHGSLLSWDIY